MQIINPNKNLQKEDLKPSFHTRFITVICFILLFSSTPCTRHQATVNDKWWLRYVGVDGVLVVVSLTRNITIMHLIPSSSMTSGFVMVVGMVSWVWCVQCQVQVSGIAAVFGTQHQEQNGSVRRLTYLAYIHGLLILHLHISQWIFCCWCGGRGRGGGGMKYVRSILLSCVASFIYFLLFFYHFIIFYYLFITSIIVFFRVFTLFFIRICEIILFFCDNSYK